MIQLMVSSYLVGIIEKTLKNLAIEQVSFSVEHPEDMSHGDYATNVALKIFSSVVIPNRKFFEETVNKNTKITPTRAEHSEVFSASLGKNIFKSPFELAERIKEELKKEELEFIENIEVVKPGFINFRLSSTFFSKAVEVILEQGSEFGKNENLSGKKTIIEYTDPNPFKEFHIGHTMSNAIGEAISRIIEWNGAEVKRACYQGDKGIHVARAVAHKIKTGVDWQSSKDVALSYALGSKLYEENEDFKKFVVEVNKKIYSEEEEEINKIYMFGRKLTLDYFETLYKILGTKFDYYFFESTTGEFGKALVHKHIPDIFEESEGAVIYRGEKRDPKLHTRVFINKEGLPTYEAKELGLAKIKYDTYSYDDSVVITGNEVNDYFKVLLSAMSEIFPELAKKTHHIGHGMLRLPTGKMSSRTGDVTTAETLISMVSEKIKEKMHTSEKDLSEDSGLVSDIAVGAIKYSILRQALGRDVIFDFDSAISFEGDSGPYLQYTNARINSLLEKGRETGINPSIQNGEGVSDLEKMLVRFPEIVTESYKNIAPHTIATYLIQIASLFNSFYGNNQIVDLENKEVSSHRLAIAKACGQVLSNGLSILGIKAPERM